MLKRMLRNGRVRPGSERTQTFAMKRTLRNEPGERIQTFDEVHDEEALARPCDLRKSTRSTRSKR